MFANDFNIVGNKIHRVKPNTKLSDEIKITTGLHFLNEGCTKHDKASTFI